MATAPWFVLGPSTLLSIYGLIRGPDRTVPTPAEDWRKAVVDVVIPAYQEEANILLSLASIAEQTLRPRQVILVDDGSDDQTCSLAADFAKELGLDLIVIRRASSIGKTPTIKRQAREFDPDVEFILDADTILVSRNYIERCVQELYQGVGIASACGTVLPMRQVDRDAVVASPVFQKYAQKHSWRDPFLDRGVFQRLWWQVTNLYRGALYLYLQRFVYIGQMTFCGSIIHPVGCAVAYRRKYIEDVFDKFEPLLGDDLTNSEDIFLGFALDNEGYRNIQVPDITCRTEEPEAPRVPGQLYMWSSSFLQCCFYFDPLLRSPFKSLKRWRKQRREKHGRVGREIQEKRKIKEPYRQAFGEPVTAEYGRPVGWVTLLVALEKISFPTAIIIMVHLASWEPLAVTLLAEVTVSASIMAVISSGQRIRGFFKAIAIAPIRYFLLLADMVTTLRFASDIWLFGNRQWRK